MRACVCMRAAGVLPLDAPMTSRVQALMLLKVNSREIAQSVLGLVKVRGAARAVLVRVRARSWRIE